VLTYYTLTFALSWGGLLQVVGGPSGLTGSPEQADRLPGIAFSLMAGPSVTGLLMTGLTDGRAGLHDLLGRLLRWRVGARWYALALLTAPLVAAAVFSALSLRSHEFVPPIVTTDDKASLLLASIATALAGALLEELGWTGFAIPRLKRHHGVVATGLMVGVLWGAWHFLGNCWYSGVASGGLSVALFLAVYFLTGVAQLTAYRVLMVWLYDRTGSLLLAVLMHASLILASVPLIIPATTGVAFLTWFIALTTALWVVVAGVAVAHRGQLVRQPLRWRAA
jgi:CAAX protease family protein